MRWPLLIAAILFCTPISAEIAYDVFPLTGEGYDIKNDRIYFRREGCGFTLAGGDSVTRQNYYSARGFRNGDPLAHLIRSDNAVVLLTVFNRTGNELRFDPSRWALEVEGIQYLLMHTSDLMRSIATADRYTRSVIEQSVFHQAETIPASQVASKFLIFKGTPDQAKVMNLRADPQLCSADAVFRFGKAKVIRN